MTPGLRPRGGEGSSPNPFVGPHVQADLGYQAPRSAHTTLGLCLSSSCSDFLKGTTVLFIYPFPRRFFPLLTHSSQKRRGKKDFHGTKPYSSFRFQFKIFLFSVTFSNSLSIHSRLGHVLLLSILIALCGGALVAKLCPFATPWTVARQAPLSMEFSRQEYWSGLPFPSPL